jgi:hypothetical protein
VIYNVHASEKQFRRLPPCGGAPPSLLPWVGAVELRSPPAPNSSSSLVDDDRHDDHRRTDAAPMERRRRRRVRVLQPLLPAHASSVRPSAASGGVGFAQGHWPLRYTVLGMRQPGRGGCGRRQRLLAAAAMTSAQLELRYEQQVRAKVLRDVDAATHVQVSAECESVVCGPAGV